MTGGVARQLLQDVGRNWPVSVVCPVATADVRLHRCPTTTTHPRDESEEFRHDALACNYHASLRR